MELSGRAAPKEGETDAAIRLDRGLAPPSCRSCSAPVTLSRSARVERRRRRRAGRRDKDRLPDSPEAPQRSNRAFENQKTVNGNTKPAPETKRKQADARLNPLKNPLCKPDVPSHLTNKPPAVVTSQPVRHDRGVSGRKEPIERQQKTARRKRPSCFFQKPVCHTVVQVMKNTQRQDQIERLQTVRKKRPPRTVAEIKRRRNTEPGGTAARPPQITRVHVHPNVGRRPKKPQSTPGATAKVKDTK